MRGRVIPRGDSLVLDFYYKGQRLRPTIPSLSPRIKAHRTKAENLLIQIQADIATGNLNLYQYFPEYPKARQFRQGSDITISEQIKCWLDRKHRECSPSTFRDYQSAIKTHLEPSFGELRLSELTSRHIRDWINDQVISNKRINNVLIPLRTIYKEAYQDSLIESNPLDRVPNLSLKTPEVSPFTIDEMNKILNACDGQIKNIFTFAFWSGVRTSELVALTWDDVDLEAKTAFIRSVRTRAGQKDYTKTTAGTRKLELLPPAYDAIQAQLA